MKEKTKIIMAMFLMILLGGALGYSFGFYSGIKFTVIEGMRFLNEQGIDFTFSLEQIAQLMFKYKGLIDSGGSGTL